MSDFADIRTDLSEVAFWRGLRDRPPTPQPTHPTHPHHQLQPCRLKAVNFTAAVESAGIVCSARGGFAAQPETRRLGSARLSPAQRCVVVSEPSSAESW